ncbi:Sec-independent protein translocase protein TatB [Porticoccaceae bacterium]|jgi:sec-independent protein translocase protein TatB|nr:Sec-independent protein translocase protein TatB [Porticoccaceae bacterium]
MFDIGFSELLVIGVLALIVMGPERMPEAVRTIGLWLGRLRQAFSAARSDLENEVGMHEVRRQLHNEKILRDLEDSKVELTQKKAELEANIADLSNPIDPSPKRKS